MPALAPLLAVPPHPPRRGPLCPANVTLFQTSTFFIIAQTQLGLQLDIQLVPIMQVFVRLAPQNRGQSCGKRVTAPAARAHPRCWAPSGASLLPSAPGLCGTSTRTRPMTSRTISGVVEGSAAALSPTPGRP